MLLNNLGSVSQLEMNILTAEIIQWARSKQSSKQLPFFTKGYLSGAELVIKRFYSGTFLTSLDGHGISITILRVYDENLLTYLGILDNFMTRMKGVNFGCAYKRVCLETFCSDRGGLHQIGREDEGGRKASEGGNRR